MKIRFLIPLLALPVALFAGEGAELQPLSDTEADAIVAAEVAARTEREANRPINRVEFEVLDEREAPGRDGGRLIVRRVTPPEIPEREPEPVSDSLAELTDEERAIIEEYGLTPVEVRYLGRFDFKWPVAFPLSATIYAGGITRIRWRHEGMEYTAYSSIDFNHLRGVRGFDGPGGEVYYVLNMGIGDAVRESLPEDRPSLPEFDAGRAEYVVDVRDAAVLDDAITAPLDALHDWYEAHEPRLKIETQRREAINAAWERHREANPPEVTDTVIHYWPKKSRRY